MKKVLFGLFSFLIFQIPAFAQEIITVRGTVLEAETEFPLPGVNIIEKGTSNGVVTDFDGEFAIDVPSTGILEISYVGFATQEIEVAGETEFEISLSPQTGSLDEVVLVGYGKQTKQSVVGSQSTIAPSVLRSAPVRDLTTAIAGRLAGVTATQRSGGPASQGADLLIRGVGTFSSSPQAPLLVVDGVPDRDINNIDPEDIESFTVLKDATATAVYGTRGANGVILITTKRGVVGPPSINVEANTGVTRFTYLPEFLDAPGFMRMYNEGLEMRDRTPLYSQEDIDLHASGVDTDLYPNTDWYDHLFNEFGTNTQLNLNIRGGAEKATYYISAGYFGEVGQFKTEDIEAFNSSLKLDRFNFTSNLVVNLTETTEIDFGVNGFITNLNQPAYGVNSIFHLATAVSPHVIPTRFSNGQWSQGHGLTNPYMELTNSGVSNQYRNAVRSNLRVNQDLDFFIKGLSATAMFAFDVNAWNTLTRSQNLPTHRALGRNELGDLVTEDFRTGTDEISFSLSRAGDRRYYAEGALNYANDFGDHSVSGLLLFNQSDYSDARSGVNSYTAAIPYRQRNYVGRGTYGYDDKYFIEANFSISGSDNFVPSERYGFFPSAGAGWVVSEESFFEPVKDVVSYFKLRYTYGLTGNAAVNDPNLRFLYLTTLGTKGSYSFGHPSSRRSFQGIGETRIGGDVKWSTAYRQNLGVEFNLLNDDLQFVIELFKDRTEGILLPNYVIPYISGFTAGNIPYNNLGITKNKGIDVTVDYNKYWTADSFFTFRGTFNTNENEVIHDGGPGWKYPHLNRTGHSISQRFGYIATGLFETQEEVDNAAQQAGDVRVGDIRYKDLSGDGIINADDQTAIGHGAIPEIVYGISFGGGYRGFDLSLFFQGVGKVDFNYAGGFGTQPFTQGATYGNMYETLLDRWTPENPDQNALYPRLSTNSDATTNYYTSNWWVKPADYLRLKQAEFGYTFRDTNDTFLQRYGINTLRAFATGTNLFTLSQWDFWDPELGNGRGTNYPNVATYNLGVRINFN